MNWKLIFQLSIFGLVMAFATVFWIPAKFEPFFWLIIFIICAWLIAKNCTDKYFLHGFLVSIVNSVWITAVHILFYNTYMTNHPEMIEMNSKMPIPEHPKWMMLLIGAAAGIFFGLILGLFAFIASKLVRKPSMS